MEEKIKKQPQSRWSKWKRRVGALAFGTFLTGLALLGGEAYCRLSPNDPTALLRRVKGDDGLEYIVGNKNRIRKIRPELERTLEKLRIPLELKEEHATNIFVLGESNIDGYNSGTNGSPATMIQFILSKTLKRSINTHNIGIIGHGLTTLEEIVKEIKHLGGKGIWSIHAGQNQSQPQEVHHSLAIEHKINQITNWLWNNSRLYRNIAPQFPFIPKKLKDGEFLLSTSHDYKRQIILQTKKCLDSIIKKTSPDKVILSTLISNYEFPPADLNIYESIKDKQRWDSLTQQGLEALIDNDSKKAINSFEEMRGINSDSPMLSFLLAKSYESSFEQTQNPEHLKKAQFFYQDALSNDRILMRILPEVNETIRKVSKKYPNRVTLADIQKEVVAGCIPGWKIHYDWVHLSPEAHYNLVAKHLAEAIIKIVKNNGGENIPEFEEYKKDKPPFIYRPCISSAGIYLNDVNDPLIAKTKNEMAKREIKSSNWTKCLFQPITLLDNGEPEKAREEIRRLRIRYGLGSFEGIVPQIPIEATNLTNIILLLERNEIENAKRRLEKLKKRENADIKEIEEDLKQTMGRGDCLTKIMDLYISLYGERLNEANQVIVRLTEEYPPKILESLINGDGLFEILNSSFAKKGNYANWTSKIEQFRIGQGFHNSSFPPLHRIPPGHLEIILGEASITPNQETFAPTTAYNQEVPLSSQQKSSQSLESPKEYPSQAPKEPFTLPAAPHATNNNLNHQAPRNTANNQTSDPRLRELQQKLQIYLDDTPYKLDTSPSITELKPGHHKLFAYLDENPNDNKPPIFTIQFPFVDSGDEPSAKSQKPNNHQSDRPNNKPSWEDNEPIDDLDKPTLPTRVYLDPSKFHELPRSLKIRESQILDQFGNPMHYVEFRGGDSVLVGEKPYQTPQGEKPSYNEALKRVFADGARPLTAREWLQIMDQEPQTTQPPSPLHALRDSLEKYLAEKSLRTFKERLTSNMYAPWPEYVLSDKNTGQMIVRNTAGRVETYYLDDQKTPQFPNDTIKFREVYELGR